MTSKRPSVDELRVTVLAREMDCNAWTCAVFYKVRTEVLSPNGESVWHSVSRYGQGDHDTPINAKLFENFAAEVTDYMRKAKLPAEAGKCCLTPRSRADCPRQAAQLER